MDNLSVLLIVVGAPNQTSETASPSSSSKLPSAQFDLNQEADFAVVETPARRIGFETILEESGAQLSDDSHNNRRSLGSSLEQQVNTSGKKRNSRIVSRPNSAVKVDESYADYVMDDSRPSVPTTVQPARRNSRMTYSNSSSFSEDWNEPELALSTIDVDVGSTYVGINTPLSTHMKSAGDFSSPLKQLFSPVNSVEYYQDESVSSPLNSKTSSNIKKQLKFN